MEAPGNLYLGFIDRVAGGLPTSIIAQEETMARRVRDRNLDNRDGRSKLPVQGKPHWRSIEPGAHIGYRRLRGRSGTWTSRVYLGNGQYDIERIGVADDLSDADGHAILSFSQAQNEVRRRMVRRVHSANGVASGPLTVAAAIDLYCRSLEDNGRDASGARGRAALHILPSLGNIEVSSLTPEHLRTWIGQLAKGNPGETDERLRARRSSANRTWSVLRAALNFAYHEGKVEVDRWRRVRPLAKANATRVDFLSVEQARRLINAADPEFKMMIRAALSTGCRYGELCRLQSADFNSDNGSLHIRRSKSGKERHIHLTDEAVELFSELCAGKLGDDLILRRADGSAWRASNQQRLMLEAVKVAKISPPISFHSLRHTFASLAVMNGTPLLVVAKALGHADTQMVQKHYAHLSKSYEAEQIRAGAPVFGFKRATKVTAFRGKQ
jgi:integrase